MKQNSNTKIYEFSKKVVVCMVLLWFIVAFYGMGIILNDNTLLPSLFEFVGQPVTGTIVLYMAKTAFENREKIKGNIKSVAEELIPPTIEE